MDEVKISIYETPFYWFTCWTEITPEKQSFRTQGRPYIFSAPATHFPETTPQYGYGFPKPGCYWIQNYTMKKHSDHLF